MTELEQEATPPPHLKRRVTASLRERGLLRGSGTNVWLMRVAAAAVLFLGGFLTAKAAGAGAAGEQVASGPRWLLLLYEDSTFSPRAPIPELVREYAAWADSLRSAGSLELGEKLGMSGTVISEEFEDHNLTASDLGEVAGMFIVRAADESAARAIARSCPHLRHNGRVVVKAIEAT